MSDEKEQRSTTAKGAGYIGDGVYVDCDGERLTLRTERGSVVHEIVLEPTVYEALVQFAQAVGIDQRRPAPRRLLGLPSEYEDSDG